LTGHEWERAPESPCGACPDRDGQLLQAPPNRRAAAVRTARRGVRRRGVTQRGGDRSEEGGSEEGPPGAMRRGMGKQMVMILELRKTRRQN